MFKLFASRASGGGDRETASLLPAAAPAPPSPALKTSMALAAVNFANGVVGAGIVGLPSALSQAGLPLGVFFCVFVAVLSQYTIRLLAELGNAHGLSSYLELSARAFGPTGYNVCAFFQATFAFGAMLTYLVIFADTVPAVLRDAAPAWCAANPGLVDRRAILALVGALLLLPLSLIRAFGLLARLGLLKLFATLFLAGTVCFYATALPVVSAKSAEWKYREVHSTFFPALGTIAFAFVCHHQTFLVQGSLRNATPRRFAITVALAIFGSFALSLSVAVAGYLTFFEATAGDLFVNYERVFVASSAFPQPGLLLTARLLLALNMLITFPGELLVARQTVENVVERWRRSARRLALAAPSHDAAAIAALAAQLREAESALDAASADKWTPSAPVSRPLVEHVAITAALLVAALGIAMGLSDITVVLNLTGSTAAVFLSFLLPAAIRLRLGAHSEDTLPVLHRNNWAPLLVLIFGAVSFVASTGVSLAALIFPDALAN
jgi:sodium-coupled neutral amino acid transporter 11